MGISSKKGKIMSSDMQIIIMIKLMCVQLSTNRIHFIMYEIRLGNLVFSSLRIYCSSLIRQRMWACHEKNEQRGHEFRLEKLRL